MSGQWQPFKNPEDRVFAEKHGMTSEELEKLHTIIGQAAKELMLTCQYCHRQKLDVCERPDGYAEDVNNEVGATHICCDHCNQERNSDI